MIELGLWKHYKGGLYRVIGLATHHETRKPMVLYVSFTNGTLNARPLVGWTMGYAAETRDVDGWLDRVRGPDGMIPRFVKVPEDTTE